MAEIFSGILKEFFKINYLENDFFPSEQVKKCQTKKKPFTKAILMKSH